MGIIFDRAYNACQSHLRQFSRANSGLLQNGVGDWEVRYRRDLFEIFSELSTVFRGEGGAEVGAFGKRIGKYKNTTHIAWYSRYF